MALDGLARRVAEAADLVTVALDALLPRADGPESRLTEAMRYAALGPGKRLRPGRVAELRKRFWESRVGRWTARVLGEGRHSAPDQLVPQATELAIGGGAAHLTTMLDLAREFDDDVRRLLEANDAIATRVVGLTDSP